MASKAESDPGDEDSEISSDIEAEVDDNELGSESESESVAFADADIASAISAPVKC